MIDLVKINIELMKSINPDSVKYLNIPREEDYIINILNKNNVNLESSLLSVYTVVNGVGYGVNGSSLFFPGILGFYFLSIEAAIDDYLYAINNDGYINNTSKERLFPIMKNDMGDFFCVDLNSENGSHIKYCSDEEFYDLGFNPLAFICIRDLFLIANLSLAEFLRSMPDGENQIEVLFRKNARNMYGRSVNFWN